MLHKTSHKYNNKFIKKCNKNGPQNRLRNMYQKYKQAKILSQLVITARRFGYKVLKSR